MDVVVAVVDCDPADTLVLAAKHRQAGVVHDPGGDVVPRAVAEVSVLGSRAQHAVPDVQVRCALADRRDRLLKESDQTAEVPDLFPVPAEVNRRLKAGGVLPAADQVRVDMLVSAAFPVQVAEHARDVLARLDDTADHIRLRTFSAASSMLPTTSASRASTGCRSMPGTMPELIARAI